jgi:hypothetical protein
MATDDRRTQLTRVALAVAALQRAARRGRARDGETVRALHEAATLAARALVAVATAPEPRHAPIPVRLDVATLPSVPHDRLGMPRGWGPKSGEYVHVNLSVGPESGDDRRSRRCAFDKRVRDWLLSLLVQGCTCDTCRNVLALDAITRGIPVQRRRMRQAMALAGKVQSMLRDHLDTGAHYPQHSHGRD